MIKKEYNLEGLGCANCAAKIEAAVGKLDGVLSASVSFATATLIVELQNDDDISPKIEKIVHSIESDVVVSEKTARSFKSRAETPKKEKRTVFVLNTVSSCDDKCCVDSNAGDECCVDSNADDEYCVDLNAGDGCCVDAHVDDVSNPSTPSDSKKSKIRFSVFRYSNKKRAARILAGVLVYLIGILIHISHNTEIPFISALGIVHPALVEYIVFIIAYLIIGGGVVYKAVRGLFRREFFDENFLMTIATLGAFALGEFTEAVAVMLFYEVGELFQEAAVSRSRKSIYEMMDIRPDHARKINASGGYDIVSPETVDIGDTILIKPGEKVPLDGIILSGNSFMDTSALTGESVPRTVHEGDTVLSGSINKSGTLTVRVEKSFAQSTASKILDLVENAASKKAPTEKFITRFSRYYTPMVTAAAVLIAFIPPIILPGASFDEWIYRGLVFLVISCPCALVLSVPLSYFGGIGAASKKGVLVKGGNYLEGLTQVKTVIFDKTGTLSKGVFDLVRIDLPQNAVYSEKEILAFSAAAESFSNHPIALSIVRAAKKDNTGFTDAPTVSEHTEYAGLGIKAVCGGKTVVIGSMKLMAQEMITVSALRSVGAAADAAPGMAADTETHIYIAVDSIFAGRIAISDVVRPDSKEALTRLKRLGIEKTVMVTGDTDKIGRAFAAGLGLDAVYTERLPHQKVEALEEIEAQTKSADPNAKTAFVGDGMNDAPALTRADIGIAVGGVGSDAAVEAADVVLMTGDPKQLADAFEIAKRTKKIVYQNIIFALGIKFIFMVFGVFGIVSMWEAVFADVGVTMIAVLNSMRLLRVK